MIHEYAKINIAERGLTIYRVAHPGWRVMWNRYQDKTIGFAIVTGRMCWSIVWAKA